MRTSHLKMSLSSTSPAENPEAVPNKNLLVMLEIDFEGNIKKQHFDGKNRLLPELSAFSLT